MKTMILVAIALMAVDVIGAEIVQHIVGAYVGALFDGIAKALHQ